MTQISPLKIDHRARIELFRVYHGREDVGEDFELISDAHIVSIRGYPVRNNAFTYLAVDERLDHAFFQGHFADPMIRFQSHRTHGGR
jgi:hypothetical protein